MNLSRRNFLQLGAAAGALAYVSGSSVVSAAELAQGGKSVSKTKKERKAIPSSCFQCPAICGIIAYVEDGRVVKIEGNPNHPNNQGAICAKGQAGMSQAYDPQRILYPMIQTKERGDKTGWKRVSWDEALKAVADRIKKNMDEKRPDKVFIMPGRDRSAGYLARFANAIGTPHVISRSGTCSQSKKTGFNEAWGYDSNWNDYAHAKMVLNFGHGILESGSVFVGNTKALTKGIAENGTQLVTIDPRFSHTAAKSAEWVPVKPGTDLAMILAMHYVILKNKLQDPAMEKWFNYPLDKYLAHLEKYGYTPAWAEKISGVPAATIERLAKQWATTKPGCVTAYKGVGGHTNGAMTTKAIIILAALVGNLNVKGGTFYNKTASYKNPAGPPAPTAKKTAALKANPLQAEANSTLFEKWDAGVGEVDMIMTWVHNPVYVLGNVEKKIAILKDRKKIPFFVAIDLFMSESTSLADLILPDVSYLERNDPESHYPTSGKPWVALRQNVMPNKIGEGMEQCEILRALAQKIGPDVAKWFDLSRVDYVKAQVKDSLPGFEAWGGYEKLKTEGVYAQQVDKFEYDGLASKTVKDEDLKDSVFDGKTGIHYAPKKDKDGKVEMKDGQPVADTTKALGVKLADGKVYKGWNTAHKKIGLYSDKWEKQFPGMGLPMWEPSATVAQAKEDELICFQYKFATLTHSRTSNCKWLSELRHDNPVLMNPKDATRLGLKDGDTAQLKSMANARPFTVKVTEGIVPGTCAVGWGPGHWEYGAMANAGEGVTEEMKKADPDYGRIWWTKKGTNVNWLVGPVTDPIGGNQEWAWPVKVTKA
ncbi:MAG: twin-arginine translocation pathway signal [Symbiobacteriaceae bacterium]|jgi:anaerobic selenocysteine-containing dehydrogenase|nr:twin-arginine translocation pathway signal [Symbiobacteriaceae bacterium]